jgi:hypothetical protein
MLQLVTSTPCNNNIELELYNLCENFNKMPNNEQKIEKV